MVLKEGTDRYLMWYSGHGQTEEHNQLGIELTNNLTGQAFHWGHIPRKILVNGLERSNSTRFF